MKFACMGPTIAAGLVLAGPALGAQPSSTTAISLPAQDLASSLQEVAIRTGRSVIAPSELVRGRRAPPLSGSFSAEAAIRALLAGSGLTVRAVGKTLVIAGPDEEGREKVATDGTGASTGAASIIVTGSHLRGAPASSPRLLISREDIERSGATSVEQLMRKLPQNSQNGVNQENFGAILPDQDVTDHGAGINLRGLGQRATLVLLNGQRLAPSGFGSFVDVSLIPLSLVERVDVLTDGASAVYGSDAVGGVVNFILRDRVKGVETVAQAGAATRGGGEQLLASQAGGTDWGSGHGLVAYEFRREDEVRAGQRPFTINLRPDTFLLPRERRHSLLGAVDQQIARNLGLRATATFAHRSTARTYFQSNSPLPVDARAKADALTGSAELSYALGDAWRVRLEGNAGLSETDQRQVRAGAQGLVNARDVRNAIYGAAIKADGALFDLPGGPVKAALGAEIRHETYRDGFESASIARSVDRDRRTVRSLFGELSLPLVSARNRMAGVERLELSAAGRFDSYSRSGSTFDPKLGLLWSPAVGLDLRASYGTSFRAPLLSEIGGAYNVIFLPASFIFKNPSQAPAGGITAILQGSNPDVRPETSKTWSAGADLSPRFAPGLKLSLNYYSVRFANRIALPTRFIIVVGDPAFEPIIDRSPDAARLGAIVDGAQLILDATGPGFSNGHATAADVDIVLDDRVSNTASTRTRGLDFTARYAFDAGPNHLTVDANVNHVLQFDDRLTAASAITRTLDRVYGPLAWRFRGGVGWSRGGWAASGFVNHADGYEDDRRPAIEPVGPFTTIDLALSYQFGRSAGALLRGTRLSAYAENLFDRKPPTLRTDPASSSGLGYDPVNASGRGRFLSFAIRKSW